MLKKGTAKVKIIALGRKIDHTYLPVSYTVGKFYVQVGAFRNKLYAYRYRWDLSRRLKLRVKVVKLKDYYRVLVGPISNYSKAVAYRKRLRRLGLNGSFIIRLGG